VIDACTAATRRAGSTTAATPTATPTRWTAASSSPRCATSQAGEELNYDYGLVIDERYTPKLKAEYPCWCGSAHCRGTLLAPKLAPLRKSPPAKAKAGREILPEIDSTNTELMRRARAGQAEPVLLVAETQTAGRGRLGRGWHSAPGASLTFSLGLPLAPADWSGLSLAVGVSLAGSLHPAIGLKWPNDLWWEQRKLAGILIETAAIGSQRHAVIGIGVNIAPPPTQEGLATPAAALQELLPGIDAPGALLKIAEPLVRALVAFEQTGFSPFAARFQVRDVLEGREVVLSDGQQGTARGVDETGALLVHTAAGLQRVTSSEVSVRPRPPLKT
jgi:BirA family biotin operon repressor/biotin-[acetyl-CoA-carboxylase] ligase